MTATGKTLDTSWLAKIEEDLKVRDLLPLGENKFYCVQSF